MSRPNSRLRHASITALAILVSSVSLGQTPSFQFITGPADYPYTRPLGISGGGEIIAGISINEASRVQGFTWTPLIGRTDWISPAASPTGVSGDATTIVGQYVPPEGHGRAFRRVGDGDFENLGILPGYATSHANRASWDGTAIVGSCRIGPAREQYSQAFLWTPQQGMRGLDPLPGALESEPLDISADGSTVVGWSFAAFGTTRQVPIVWRNGGQPQVLPLAPGGDRYGGQAQDVTSDGRVVVGSSYNLGANRAVRWIDGALELLPIPLDYESAGARYLSDDGRFIVGSVGSSLSGLPARSYLWRDGGDGIFLEQFWSDNGIAIPEGWILTGLTAVSGDAQAFTGTVERIGGGDSRGFLVSIPTPSSIITFVFSTCILSFRRRLMMRSSKMEALVL